MRIQLLVSNQLLSQIVSLLLDLHLLLTLFVRRLALIGNDLVDSLELSILLLLLDLLLFDACFLSYSFNIALRGLSPLL